MRRFKLNELDRSFTQVINTTFSAKEKVHLERAMSDNPNAIMNETQEEEVERIKAGIKLIALTIDFFADWIDEKKGKFAFRKARNAEEQYYMDVPLNLKMNHRNTERILRMKEKIL